MGTKFIRKAKLKKGGLSRQLGIPSRKVIPIILLNKIVRAEVGDKIRNPSKSGKKIIIITKLLKRRSVFARTLKNFKRKRN